ncbi:MAG: tetratricopeptide repeat protein [Nannocystaceae bacterium]
MTERARWDELADARAIDDALTNEQARFVDDFDDELVERERAVYRALVEQGQPGPVDAGDRQRALATLAEHRRACSPPPRRRAAVLVGVGLAATVLTVAAALLLWVQRPGPTMLTPRPAAAVASGTLMLDQVELGPGDGVPLGRWVVARAETCVTTGRSRGCVSSGSRLRVHDDGIELAAGTLQLWGSATVRTEAGELVAEDAQLRVSLDGDRPAVDTIAGAVTLREDDREAQRVAAGERVAMGLVARAEPDPELPEPEPEPEPVEPPPPSVVRPLSKSATGSPYPAAAAPGDLLSAARRHVARGQVDKALQAYATLRRQFPRSPEAQAANVSIGQLELRRGRSKSALRAFQRYLGEGGPMAEEAHWGKIQALHRLGRTRERDTAIATLRKAHPSSVYLSRATKL